MDARVIGERSDAVLRTAMPGREPECVASTVRDFRFNFQTARGSHLANAPPPLFFVFEPRGKARIPFSFSPLSRGWSAGRRQGACEAPFTGLRGRCFTPRFRDPSLEGGGGPGARGPLRGALRLPALHRVRVVGAPALLRLRTPRSTTPSIEQGAGKISAVWRAGISFVLGTTRGFATLFCRRLTPRTTSSPDLIRRSMRQRHKQSPM